MGALWHWEECTVYSMSWIIGLHYFNSNIEIPISGKVICFTQDAGILVNVETVIVDDFNEEPENDGIYETDETTLVAEEIATTLHSQSSTEDPEVRHNLHSWLGWCNIQ